MVNEQQTRSPKNRSSKVPMAQLGQSELMELLEKLEYLQRLLHRLLSLLESQSLLHDIDSAQRSTRSQIALQTIDDDISHSIASHPSLSVRFQLANWEDEGGRIDHVSV